MPIDHSKLAVGQEVSAHSITLDREAVSRYVDAVDDRSSIPVRDGEAAIVPPMAVAALSLGAVITDLQIPPQTLHMRQELEFNGAVRIGQSVRCKAHVAQNTVRRGTRLLTVEMEVDDESGNRVLSGKGTIVFPE